MIKTFPCDGNMPIQKFISLMMSKIKTEISGRFYFNKNLLSSEIKKNIYHFFFFYPQFFFLQNFGVDTSHLVNMQHFKLTTKIYRSVEKKETI